MTSIASIPDELLVYSFSFLDLNNLTNCSQVCKKWKELSENDYLWRKFSDLKFSHLFVPHTNIKAYLSQIICPSQEKFKKWNLLKSGTGSFQKCATVYATERTIREYIPKVSFKDQSAQLKKHRENYTKRSDLSCEIKELDLEEGKKLYAINLNVTYVEKSGCGPRTVKWMKDHSRYVVAAIAIIAFATLVSAISATMYSMFKR